MPASATQEQTTAPTLTEEQRYIRDTLLGNRAAGRPPAPPASAARAVAPAQRGTFDVADIIARVKQVLDGPAEQGLVERLAKKASSDRPYANQILLDFQQSGISSADLDKVLRGLGPQYLSKLVRLLGDSFELRAYLAEKQVRWDLLYEYWEFSANDGFKFFSGFLVGAGKDAIDGVRTVVQLTQHLAKEEQRLLQAATAWVTGDRARTVQILGERVEFYRSLLVAFSKFLEDSVRRLSLERVINYPMDWVYAKTREYNSLLLRREIYEAGVLIGEIAAPFVGILIAAGYKLLTKIGKKISKEVVESLADTGPTTQLRQELASLPPLTALQVRQMIPYNSLKEFFIRIDSILQRDASEIVRILTGDRMWMVWQRSFGELAVAGAYSGGGTIGAQARLKDLFDLGRDMAHHQRDETTAELIEHLDDQLAIHELGTGGRKKRKPQTQTMSASPGPTSPTPAHPGPPGSKTTPSDIEDAVERGITEETDPTGAARPVRPKKAPATGLAARARRSFDKLRDGYAVRLGVGPGGQVHHAIELQVLDRYPGLFTEQQLNAFENMRGIATELVERRQLHNSKIREMWDRHYVHLDREIDKRGLKVGTAKYRQLVQRFLQEARDDIDHVIGQFFTEYRKGLARSFD